MLFLIYYPLHWFYSCRIEISEFCFSNRYSVSFLERGYYVKYVTYYYFIIIALGNYTYM